MDPEQALLALPALRAQTPYKGGPAPVPRTCRSRLQPSRGSTSPVKVPCSILLSLFLAGYLGSRTGYKVRSVLAMVVGGAAFS